MILVIGYVFVSQDSDILFQQADGDDDVDDLFAEKKSKKLPKGESSVAVSTRTMPVKSSKSSSSVNASAKIEMLSFNKYTTGCLAFGYVLKISETPSSNGVDISNASVLISLPGGMTGSVAYGELSDVTNNLVGQYYDKSNALRNTVKFDPISSFLQVGQPVRAYVMDVTYVHSNISNSSSTDKKQSVSGDVNSKKRKQAIILSLRASYVNKYLNSNTAINTAPAKKGKGRNAPDSETKHKYLRIGFPISGCVVKITDIL